MEQPNIRPQPQIVTIWRILLAMCVFPVAFLSSLLLEIGGTPWTFITLGWIVVFVYFYLIYFPLRFRSLFYTVLDDRFLIQCGVFYKQVFAVPFTNIQFSHLRFSPLHSLWNLTTLTLISPGGRARLTGLRTDDAKRLIVLLFGPDSEPDGHKRTVR